MDVIKYQYLRFALSLLVMPGLASGAFASAWTCHKAELTREVIIFYPEAPARLPCKVFYAKPDEDVMPRALWEAKNTQKYCEQKAAEFIEKLSSMGWSCSKTTSKSKPEY